MVLASAVAAAAGEPSADWTEFRGPTGQGHAGNPGLPLHWSATSNVVWSAAIPGGGWSSPVIAGGRVYLTTAVEEDGSRSLRALAVDAADGKILWDREVFRPEGSPGIHGKNSHASATPLFRDGKLYVHFGHQGTAALDRDGNVLWRQTSLKYPPVHGNGGSPVWAEGALIFSCDGGSDPFVVALDAGTGEVRWKTERVTPAQKKFSFSTPLLITNDGRSEIISPGSGAVCAYDPRDGRELWRVRYGEGYSVVPRPVFGHGLLFLGSGYDRPVVYAVRPAGASGDATDTAVAWTVARGAPNTPSLLLDGDELYWVSDAGVASCVDPKTGKSFWSERLGGGFSASPILADGRLLFINEEGTAFVVARGREFHLLAKNELGERTLASPAVADGALFLRTDTQLRRIGVPVR
ncbi:MAG: PQQ-binding-like beta-propeller repeat protein [Verrucomicrobiae bacterium]|nr:PQQ-binding-like beta-propeller repeat protein [Verrucomicrobiae bacterium]